MTDKFMKFSAYLSGWSEQQRPGQGHKQREHGASKSIVEMPRRRVPQLDEPDMWVTREREGGATRNAIAREKCMMCLGKVSTMTRVTMGCVHEFHRRCLYRWLKYNTNCPVCRFNFMRAIPPEEPAEEQQQQQE
ncbi:hypothetical protein niasHT_001363 [Heterodera trifolii]|uniref:RING-type domain-containing protein n=1 Tax=Heterodera trifolii TaxID=157864 RepID=A0ABD2LN05_9BILA